MLQACKDVEDRDGLQFDHRSSGFDFGQRLPKLERQWDVGWT